MNKVKFLISLLCTIGLVYLFNHPIPNTPIPPLGKLLNPFTGFWQNGESSDASELFESLPELNLSAPVNVSFDDKMVPHIFADNLKDAVTVQGYIEAKNRLWQMDFSTRATSGRLSEVVGKIAINRDKGQRRKGLVYAAENTLKTWQSTPEYYAYVEAYTAGVNAYINSLSTKDYPIEFKILDYEPEEWSPLKTAIFMKAMAEDLASRENDLESTNALSTFGQKGFDFLYPERNSKESPIIPESVEWDFEAPTLPTSSPAIGAIHHTPYEKPYEFIGSNNWAVSGSKTASGKPILCNDPHLGLSLPAIWYEIQIHTPEVNVYGVSLPGVPGVVIGFNENIAWGFTNVGHDISDWYTIKWADDKKTSYYLDGEVVKADLKIETFKVNGAPDVVDTVRYTHWGPVGYLSDDGYQDMALRWLVHDGDVNELISFVKISSSKNFDDYYNSLRNFSHPAQNVAFASNEGDIAIKVQGKFPIKANQQGRFVSDGSLKANGWKGFIPYEQTPFVKNPERGFIASANQFSADEDYPYYYNGGFEDYRGRVLNRKLEQMSNITVDDMKALQADTYSIKAEEALPLLLQFVEGSELGETEKELIDILKKWDYNYGKDDIAPKIFDSLYSAFYITTWDEMYALRKDDFPMLFPESWRLIELMSTAPENVFFDVKETTDKKETAKDIALIALKKVAEKAKNWKVDGKYKTWEEHREVRIPHLVSSLKGFRSEYIAASGNGDVLNAINANGKQNWAFGPSWRMIVELGDEPKAYGVYPAGQSGNPGSPYYDSMISTWAKGDYYELIFMKNKDQKNERILFSTQFK